MTEREWWELLNDLWQFVKKHNAPTTDEDWAAVIREAGVLQRKHEKKLGAKDLIMDVIRTWERNARNEAGADGGNI